MISLPLIHGKDAAEIWAAFLDRLDPEFCVIQDVTDSPRTHSGTGNTLPFSCVDNDLEADMLLNELILSNSSDVALGRLWARGAINANSCFRKANETGRLIGTAWVARDLISVVDAFEVDGMLRYWGE
jgi:hypothetical protein